MKYVQKRSDMYISANQNKLVKSIKYVQKRPDMYISANQNKLKSCQNKYYIVYHTETPGLNPRSAELSW